MAKKSDMADPNKAANKLGGMSGEAVKAIHKAKSRRQSQLDRIMSSMHNNQTTDSNNRK